MEKMASLDRRRIKSDHFSSQQLHMTKWHILQNAVIVSLTETRKVGIRRCSIPHMEFNRLGFNKRMKVPTVKLLSGYEIPLVGLGTWQSKSGEVGKAVEAAISAGYTHIDCAWVYGNQVEIGEALKRLFSSGHKKNVLEILDQLQLKYVDLMLIHWPVGYEEGGGPFPKIRSIGISNFNHKQIERIEIHPYFQQKKLRVFCKEKGIAVTAYR
ncbi:unnamed protein product [Angiostrongylus costaricensis]|uniref:Aldo_ket_red domain-containing protein n=1 Tax=Angiostrongylus costaricensis TaxID=334426 RepID=A0A158PM92_ANGCS|nr:unnamed protein product [Angiostrongylus costaricensis]